MPDAPVHETRSGMPPVDGTYYCAHHDQAIGSRVSWRYAILLCSVAVAFGGAVWYVVNSRCDKAEVTVNSMDKKMIRVESAMEHMKDTQVEIKREQLRMRDEMRAEFQRLRDLIKNVR